MPDLPVRKVKDSSKVKLRKVKQSTPLYKHLVLEGVSCNILGDHPIPSYTNKYDLNPHFKNENNDEFICAATFMNEAIQVYLSGDSSSDNFKDGRLRRIDRNMDPYFFVFESDNLSLEDQLKNIDDILSGPYASEITSVTFSGSKSIHVLVRIPDKFKLSIKKDFKYYWNSVGLRLFADKAEYLDKACASVSRLTRKPNGLRENKVKQTCYYYNKDAILDEAYLDFIVPLHDAELKIAEDKEAIAKRQRQLHAKESKEDDFERLEKMHNSSKVSASFEVAYNAIHGICPAGENYVAAFRSLVARGFSKDIQQLMLDNVTAAHPSNISKSRAKYLLTHDGSS